MSINRLFGAISNGRSSGDVQRAVDQWSADQRSPPTDRLGLIKYIKMFFQDPNGISIKGLEILTSRDQIPLHPSKRRFTTYRNVLADEAAQSLEAMPDEKLREYANMIPFEVKITHAKPNYEPRYQEDSDPEDFEYSLDELDERDWDCRPSTSGEVTERQLDDELFDYFKRDPILARYKLDEDLREYFKKDPRQVCPRCANNLPVCGQLKPDGTTLYSHAETCAKYTWQDYECRNCLDLMKWNRGSRMAPWARHSQDPMEELIEQMKRIHF